MRRLSMVRYASNSPPASTIAIATGSSGISIPLASMAFIAAVTCSFESVGLVAIVGLQLIDVPVMRR